MNDEDRKDKKIFRQPLNYENGVLVPKIRDISYWRDTDIKSYESGIITLTILLPGDLRSEVLKRFGNDTTFENLTIDGKKQFDQLFIFILTKLEDSNIIIPKISFDIGHD